MPARLAVLVCLLAAGCASTRSRNGAADADRWVRVDEVAEVRQSSRDGCGAAALAMVLGHWGRPASEAEIRAASSSRPGNGIRADALRDFARRQGLQAFLLEGEPADLAREVGRNRPVLVGVVKRHLLRAYPHYEVVVGIDRDGRRILTLDPARGLRESSMRRFAAEWAAAGRLTLVVFPGDGASAERRTKLRDPGAPRPP